MNPQELAYIVGDFDPIDEDRVNYYNVYLFLDYPQRCNPTMLKTVQGRENAIEWAYKESRVRWPQLPLEYDDWQVTHCIPGKLGRNVALLGRVDNDTMA